MTDSPLFHGWHMAVQIRVFFFFFQPLLQLGMTMGLSSDQ